MVSIGNFRNQRIVLGATNKNTAIVKPTLKDSTDRTNLRPGGKTTMQPIEQITTSELKHSTSDAPLIGINEDGTTYWTLHGERISDTDAQTLNDLIEYREACKIDYLINGAH